MLPYRLLAPPEAFIPFIPFFLEYCALPMPEDPNEGSSRGALFTAPGTFPRSVFYGSEKPPRRAPPFSGLVRRLCVPLKSCDCPPIPPLFLCVTEPEISSPGSLPPGPSPAALSPIPPYLPDIEELGLSTPTTRCTTVS